MPNLTFAAIDWIPTGFNWALAPVAVALVALALNGRTRPLAATGFLIAAGISASLLSLLVAASVFHLLGYGRAVADLLLNFGPSVTRDYLATLLSANGARLLTLLPMVFTAFSSIIAAIYLRREEGSVPDGGGEGDARQAHGTQNSGQVHQGVMGKLSA
jgi:hypothetical protein